MKRKIGLILAIAIALIMIKGMGVTVFAATTAPDSVTPLDNADVDWYFFICNYPSPYYGESHANGQKYDRITGEKTQANMDYALDTYFGPDTPAIEGGLYICLKSTGKFIKYPTNPIAPIAKQNLPTHTHDFVTGTIYDATCDQDGLEGTYCKTCGYILNSSPISAFGYTLETYAKQKIDASKSGQKIVLEFGELNAFPKSFMEDVAEKVAAGVTFEFRYNVNHVLQKITIPAYSTVDTTLDWYGYAKMAELYGMN